ncbi:MAG: YkgJ family cysteine cluster protein [Fimbriimonadaceae bacterium]
MGKSSRLKLERKSQEMEARDIHSAREVAHKLISEAEFPLNYPPCDVSQILVLSEAVYEEVIAAGIRNFGKAVTTESLADFSSETNLALDKFQAIAARLFHERVKVDPDCKPGCNWCCYVRVTVKVGNAAQVQRAIQALSDDQREAVLDRVKNYVAETDKLGPNAILRSTRLCPLNEEGKCLIYADRPLTCRTTHSYNVKTCRSYVEKGELSSSKTSLFAREIARYVVVAMTQVLTHYGIDGRSFELNDIVLGMANDKKVGAALSKKSGTALDSYYRADVEAAAAAEVANLLAAPKA